MTTAGHESGSACVYLTTAAAATTAVEYPGGKMARQDVREGGVCLFVCLFVRGLKSLFNAKKLSQRQPCTFDT